MRDQSQIEYRLMNLILYSHLFKSVLFTNKKEKYVYNENISYLDMIKVNWTHLEKSLQEKNIDIYIFMNLIFNELYGYLNRKNKITERIIKK